MTKHLRFLFIMLLAMVWAVGGAKAETATYKLVTDASTLKDGDVIVIGNGTSKVVMGKQDANNRDEVGATFVNGVLTPTDGNAAEITLVKVTDNSWMLQTTDGYLYAASSSKNYLKSDKTTTSTNKNAVATVSISGNNATIKFTGSNTRNTIRYNSTNKLFSCYASGQNDVQIYKKEETGKDPQISFSESTVTVNKSEEIVDLQTLTNPNNLTVTYSTSDATIAEVEDNSIFLYKAGTVKIYADTKATDVFKSGHAEYTLNIVDDRQESGIAFDNDSYTADISEESFYSYKHLTNPNGLTVTYEIAPSENVIDSKTGEVLLTDIGTYTITATFVGNDAYQPATATCTLKVTDKNAQTEEIVFDPATDKGSTTDSKADSMSKGFVAVSTSAGAFAYGSDYRFYKNSINTFSTRKGKIVKIVFEDATSYPLSNIAASDNKGEYTYDSSTKTGTWVGEAEEVQLEVNSKNQVRAAKITVTIELPTAKSFTYTETSANTIVAYENANVTLERTLYADGWNTFCVPFDVTKEQVAEVFGDGTKIMTLDESNSKGKTVEFVSAESITAHTPCLVWPATAASSYTFESVAVKSGDPDIKVGGDIMFTGIYSPKDITDGGTTNAAGLAANNKIVKVKTGGSLNAFRAYFILPDGVSASSYMLSIGGTVTAIDKIHADGQPDATAPVYNLQGQRVNNSQLPSGIYVQNGRKFVVK